MKKTVILVTCKYVFKQLCSSMKLSVFLCCMPVYPVHVKGEYGQLVLTYKDMEI